MSRGKVDAATRIRAARGRIKALKPGQRITSLIAKFSK